jgi:hypothetical protein
MRLSSQRRVQKKIRSREERIVGCYNGLNDLLGLYEKCLLFHQAILHYG